MGSNSKLAQARAASRLGRYHEAIGLLSSLLSEIEQTRPRRKALLFDVLTETGRTHRRLSGYPEAEDCLKRALGLFAAGKNELERSRALEELGVLYIEQSRYAEAESTLKESLDIRRAKLDGSHADIGETLNDLGLLAWSRGDDAKAGELYQEALEIRRRVYGKEHSTYAETLDNFGVLYQRIDRLHDAERAHREALSIREKSLGESHPDVAYSLVNLANVYQRQGKHDEVEALLRRAIRIWNASLGEEHHHTGVAINNLGGCYLEQGRFSEATPLFEKALRILEASLGSDNPGILTHLHNLATVYRHLNRNADAGAIDARIQTLALRKLSMEGRSGTQNLLLDARTLQNIKDFAAAEERLNEALQLAEREFGAQSLRVAYILDFLGTNSMKQMDLKKAKDYFLRSLSIKNETLGADHTDAEATAQNLRFLEGLRIDWEGRH